MGDGVDFLGFEVHDTNGLQAPLFVAPKERQVIARGISPWWVAGNEK